MSRSSDLQVRYNDGLRPPNFKLLRLFVTPAQGGGCIPFLRLQLAEQQSSDYPFADPCSDELMTLPEIDEEQLNAIARVTIGLGTKLDHNRRGYTVVAARLEVLGLVGICHWEGRTATRLFVTF